MDRLVTKFAEKTGTAIGAALYFVLRGFEVVITKTA